MVSESEPKNGLAFWAPGTQIPQLTDPRMALPCSASWARDTSSRMASLPFRAPHFARHLLAHILAPTAQVRKPPAFSLPLFPFVPLLFPFASLCLRVVSLMAPLASLRLPLSVSFLFPFVSLLCPFCFPVAFLLSSSVSLLSPCCPPVVSLLSSPCFP